MAIVSKEILKSYFLTGLIPTQSNYNDLVDTLVSLSDNANDIFTYISGNVGIGSDPDTDNGYKQEIVGTQHVTDNVVMDNNLYVNEVMTSGVVSTVAIAGRNTGGFTATPGSGIGTGGSVTIVGTLVSGTMTIVTGTGCLANSPAVVFAGVSLADGYSPYFILSPVNQQAASLTNSQQLWFSSLDVETGLTISTNQAALTGMTAYVWNYHILFSQNS